MKKKLFAVTCFALLLVPLFIFANSAISDIDATENELKIPETVISINSKVGSPSKYRPPQTNIRGTMISEGFEGTFPPAGWDTVSVPGGTQGGSTLIPWHPDVNYAYSGTYGAAYGWGYNLDGWLRILNLDFSSVIACTLSYWWESSYYWHVNPYDNGDLFVEVSIDGGTSWDTLWTFGDSADVVNSGGPWPWDNWIWYQATLPLDAYAGEPNVWVGFHTVADDNADMAVDDVLIDTTFQMAQPFWEILPNMPYTSSGPYVGYHVDSLGYTFVHIFGGNPSAQSLHYIFDYANGTYASGTPLPTGSTYGGTCSFNNMVYMCGAWTGASNVITIYDCINDAYTTRTLPAGGTANPTVVSKDNRYVYVIGGCRPPGQWVGGTGVDVYDAIADTFFSAPTQLPANCAVMSGAGARISGDTIIVAGGYDGSGAMTDRVFTGVINPTDPGDITWAVSGTPYPGGAFYRGAGSDWDGIGYFTGGSNNSWLFTETYSYEAGIGWVTLPSKPTGCMNLGWVMAPVDTAFTDDAEILGFAMGGYDPYLNIGEAYHTATIVTGIIENPNEGVGKFSCKLISSNPLSSGNAFIQLIMPTEGPVKFSVYDVTGRRILNREFPRINAGTHTIRWERKNDQGSPVSAGNYFYRVEAVGNVSTGKLVVID